MREGFFIWECYEWDGESRRSGGGDAIEVFKGLGMGRGTSRVL